ncbi:MAG: ComEC family competence protein [Rhodobacteraceae bacterium]|nr:ComEC family competence protein [Paracoccaceae bacterium]
MAELSAASAARRAGWPAALAPDPSRASILWQAPVLPLSPVLAGAGIALYFALPAEPPPAAVAGMALAALAFALAALRRPAARLPFLALALVLAGIAGAAVRTLAVAAPVLHHRIYGQVEGRLVDVDRSFSDALRLTLDRVRIDGLDPAATPARVRIALHGDAALAPLPPPGARLRLTASLAPPGGPVEPGGFDFQRLAWFERLGALGYTRIPPEITAGPERSAGLLAFEVRMFLSRAMQDRIGGQAGALSAAFMTGDRSGIDAATNADMRASNLSHMISISGLHMGLLVAIVLAIVRYAIALVPAVALRVDGRKPAAVAALVAATLYLALAGPDVATRRAWIMAAVMLVAVLLDRRAISLRSVAIAALIVLAAEPESLVEPGFQMSFAATAALVVAFGAWADLRDHVPPLLRPLAVMVLSSVVAGLATGPIAAAHFGRIAGYGLVANLLAAPVMGLVVMPMGVLAALAAPFGLADLPLWLMGRGSAAILAIAARVAALDGAVAMVPAPPAAVLPLLAAGGLALLPLRRAGLAVAALAFLLAGFAWATAPRPALLISADGALAGVMTPAGRALSRPKGAGFVAAAWLENDGDPATQAEAHARGAFAPAAGGQHAGFAGRDLWHFTGRHAAERARAVCRNGAIVVLNTDWGSRPPPDCMVFDLWRLRRTGAVAIDARLAVTTAVEAAGRRPWNARAVRPAAAPGQ